MRKELAKKDIAIGLYQISIEKNRAGPIVTLETLGENGKSLGKVREKPFDLDRKLVSLNGMQVVRKNKATYIVIMDQGNQSQPKAVFEILKNGELKCMQVQLQNSELKIDSDAEVKVDGVAIAKTMSVKSPLVNMSASSKLIIRQNFSVVTNTFENNAELSTTHLDLVVSDHYIQSGKLITEYMKVKAKSIDIQKEVFVSKQFDVECEGTFNNCGQVITAHQAKVRARDIYIDREAYMVSQEGELRLHASSKLTNSGALIANHIYLDAGIMITNNMGALIKAIACIHHAPQFNQAGFLLTGQKATLTDVDWGLNAIHAGINIAQLCSIFSTGTAIHMRSAVLLAKTLYRGSPLLSKIEADEEISKTELLDLVLSNIIPCLGSLTNTEEKARLLVNILYQFYAVNSSEDSFVHKSMEFVEMLTSALSVASSGYLKSEDIAWIQMATKIIRSSRQALKVASLTTDLLKVSNYDDQDAFEIAQSRLSAFGEAILREGLYQLQPIEILNSTLKLEPRDLVLFALNKGHSSNYFLQSVVIGALHAAGRSGTLSPTFQHEAEIGVRLLFASRHWGKLCDDFIEDRVQMKEFTNEALNALVLISSSEAFRSVFSSEPTNEKTPEQDVEEQSDDVIDEEAEESVEETLDTTVPIEEPVVAVEEVLLDEDALESEEAAPDPLENLTEEEITRQREEETAAFIEDIPERPHYELIADLDEIIEHSFEEQDVAPEPLDGVIAFQRSIIEIQKALNGELAGAGYLGAYVDALHNEHIMDATGEIGFKISSHGTNAGLIKSSAGIVIAGNDAATRDRAGKLVHADPSGIINSHFINFESGQISARETIQLICVGLIENYGSVHAARNIVVASNRILKNAESGAIISNEDVKILSDALAENEGLVFGEHVHFEGTTGTARNSGQIIAIEQIRLISKNLAEHQEDGTLISKRVTFESDTTIKAGSIQASKVKITGYDGENPRSVTLKQHDDDDIGALILRADEVLDLDPEAFNQIGMTDLTLTQDQLQSDGTLVNLSSDFDNVFQLHLPEAEGDIDITQLPSFSAEGHFILDAPNANLNVEGQDSYDPSLTFRGNTFNYSDADIVFNGELNLDVNEIQGYGGYSHVNIKHGGIIQAELMYNEGYFHSDQIVHWNLGTLNNELQFYTQQQAFIHSYWEPYTDYYDATFPIENSGTIYALGHHGYIDHLNGHGASFLSGKEGTFIYYKTSNQEAKLSHYAQYTGPILQDVGQSWWIVPVWHNAILGSTGFNVILGEESILAAGLTYYGDGDSVVYTNHDICVEVQLAPYYIHEIKSVYKNGHVNYVAHPAYQGTISTTNSFSSNEGEVAMIAPRGSIFLTNTTLSSAGRTYFIAKEKVEIDGIAINHFESYTIQQRKWFKTKTTTSHTESTDVYCSYIFAGGGLVVRADEFHLTAVQGVVAGADINVRKTVFDGQTESSHTLTKSKEVNIGVPTQGLISVLSSHNAKAVFSAYMNAFGWDQETLESLLEAETVGEIPGPLLEAARNGWNLAAFVAYACNEFGEDPKDFVGAFTDQVGLTKLEDGKHVFQPRMTFTGTRSSNKIHETHTIGTNFYVGGTFKLIGNELQILNGSLVDAEHLRIFLVEGIKATKGMDQVIYSGKSKSVSINLNILKPTEISLSYSKNTYSDIETTYTLAGLHGRSSVEIDAGELIEGDLLITGPTGYVRADKMHFTSSQDVRTTRQQSKGFNISAELTGGVHYSSSKEEEKITGQKAGIHLGTGTVSANEIFLENGSKIQTGTLIRKDGEEGLPEVTATDAVDTHTLKSKGFSVDVLPDGESFANAHYKDKEKQTLQRGTVLADNLGMDDLEGVNTDPSKETEVIKNKNFGLDVSAFIPDKEKYQEDWNEMKTAANRGLHFLFGKPNAVKEPGEAIEGPIAAHTEESPLEVGPDKDIISIDELPMNADVQGSLEQHAIGMVTEGYADTDGAAAGLFDFSVEAMAQQLPSNDSYTPDLSFDIPFSFGDGSFLTNSENATDLDDDMNAYAQMPVQVFEFIPTQEQLAMMAAIQQPKEQSVTAAIGSKILNFFIPTAEATPLVIPIVAGFFSMGAIFGVQKMQEWQQEWDDHIYVYPKEDGVWVAVIPGRDPNELDMNGDPLTFPVADSMPQNTAFPAVPTDPDNNILIFPPITQLFVAGYIYFRKRSEKEQQAVDAQIKEKDLPLEGEVQYIASGKHRPSKPLPTKVRKRKGYEDYLGNVWIPGNSRTHGRNGTEAEPFEWDVQLSDKGKRKYNHLRKGRNHLNVSLKGVVTH